MVGFDYTITRSRESSSLRKVVTSFNFSRFKFPASSGTFYVFPQEIQSLTHTVQLFSENGALHSALKVSDIIGKEITTETTIPSVAPFHGVGDTWKLIRTESDLSTTVLAEGVVEKYAPLSENTYNVSYRINSIDGAPLGVFLYSKITSWGKEFNHQEKDSGPPRVITHDEAYVYPEETKFSIDTSRVGIQRYTSPLYKWAFPDEETANTHVTTLTSQIASLLVELNDDLPILPPFSTLPTSATLQRGGVYQLGTVGETGPVKWLFVTNTTGAVLTTFGEYTAGSNSGTDVVRVVDASGRESSIEITVEDSFASIISGEFSWPS